jgi:hypothetical protein
MYKEKYVEFSAFYTYQLRHKNVSKIKLEDNYLITDLFTMLLAEQLRLQRVFL